MTQPSKSVQDIAAQISKVAEGSSRFAQSFGPDEETRKANIQKTLKNIQKMDDEFQENGGVFFHAGKDAFETAKKFTEIHVEQYRNSDRPSLPALAAHHAEKIGLEEDSPLYKAMLLVATRAEMKQAVTPEYHSQEHYADVTAVAANLVHENNRMLANGEKGAVPLSKEEQAIVILAAIGHDIDHDGNSNPADNPYFNENKSFTLIVPLLEDAGVDQKDIAKIHTMILTTSPNGPHSVLKNIAQTVRNDGHADWEKVAGNEKHPDLKVLTQDRNLLEMASILSDSDLYGSFGAGMESNVEMSRLLTKEVQKAGAAMDFTTDKAREGALNFLIGDGFTSGAGRKLADPVMKDMKEVTAQRIASSQSKPASR